jgi:outer membrane receptor protein involved in Fe transport
MSAPVRTTLHIDDDVYQAARSLAAAKGQGLGAVISALARKGLSAPPPAARTRRGFPTFDVPAQASTITTDMVRSAIEDE